MSNSKLTARTEGEKNRNFLGTGQQVPPIDRSLATCMLKEDFIFNCYQKKKPNPKQKKKSPLYSQYCFLKILQRSEMIKN